MGTFRAYRSPGTDRFLSLLSRSGEEPQHPPAVNGGGSGGVELDEEEIFRTGSESSDPVRSPPRQSPLKPQSSGSQSRRTSERGSGILAAVHVEGRGVGAGGSSGPLLQRKPSFSTSTSPSPSSSSSARLIPVIPKPKADFVPAAPVGNLYHHHHHQSAPVNILIVPRRARSRGRGMSAVDDDGDDDGDEDAMLPPHQIFARRSGTSPMTTFSVLEGEGRTLKGRDLRRVRNAVWRKTGFLD